MASFSSVYRARVVTITDRTVEGVLAPRCDVFVPQVFGETPILIDTYVGGPPTAPGMGWVMFQGGNPEFPVWMGVAVGGSGGNGGGGGVDEVWIGDEAPVNPATELWYDANAEAANISTIPAGIVDDYVGVVAPLGWLLMEGQTVVGADFLYPNLWLVIPATWKSGSDIVFPDTRGRMIVSLNASDADFDTVGETGGWKDAVAVDHYHTTPNHAHTENNHSHSTPDHTHPNSSTSGGSHQHLSAAQTVVAAGPNGGQTVQRMPAYSYNNGLAMQDSDGDGTPDSGGTAGFAMTWQESEYVPAQWSDAANVAAMTTSTPSGGAGTTGPAAPSTNNAAPNTNNAGVAGTKRNMPPYIVFVKIIKAH